jgi:hypothetical protein
VARPAFGETFDVEYSTRTWSRQADHLIVYLNGDSPAFVRADLATMRWSAARTGSQGRQLIELRWTDSDPPGYQTMLWVDAASYTPVRMVSHWGNTDTVTTTYQFLPVSPAALANLRPAVPSGFTRTSAAQSVCAAAQTGVC